MPAECDLNVRAFGATGDGETDDSAAFTAAGNELWKRAKSMARPWGNLNREKPSGSIEGPRPRLVVPKGRYLLKETACLRSDIVLVGEDGAELIGPDPAKDILYLHGCYRVRLENLTFRGGRHSIFAETLNKESANFRITRCRFYDSAEIAFLSPSYKTDKGPVGAWSYNDKTGEYTVNPKYWTEPKRGNNHSSMIVFDNCAFENCEGCISMCPDGSVVRNSSFVMPKGSTNSVFLCSNLMHAYGLTIVHSAGGAAFRSLGGMRMWMEDSSVTTSDGSGARVVEGSFGNGAQVANLVLSDIETDAGLAPDNAICRFNGKFPAIAALVRVTAKGPNKVRAFAFGPAADEAAFAASTSANIMQLWEQDRFYSYGLRDCGANILPIEEGSDAKRFERPVPAWAAAPAGAKARLEAPKLEKARRSVFPGTWQIRTTPWEIATDTVIDARGVAAFAGMSSDRPWFVVKKGAKAVIRNVQVRGGKSFVVVEDGGEAYVDTCFSYDAEGATFVCQKGGRLVVDNGVYYAPRLYEGAGDAFIRSIWYRFTAVVPPDRDFSEGMAAVNRGRLVIWDLLGVPTVFDRFGKDMARSEPVKRYDLRWVDNHGDYRSRMMRYGGEWGGVMSAWHHGDAKTLIEGSYDWYWNRSIPDTPVMCDAPGADVKMFAVNICLYRQFLKYIGLLYRDKDGKDVPCDSSGLQFTCPTAEKGKSAERAQPVEAMAFYYPHWHVYPRGEQWFGKGWTEWEFVKTQVPRYPGHPVPIKPLMGYYDESKPENVEKEIDLAADAGIGTFLFDWYCYDGEVIMEEALEQGFLRAKNLSRMKFALMWCYHDRYNRFRAAIDDVPGTPLIKRAGTADEFRKCMDIVIDRFMGHPQYYRKDGHPFYSVFNAPDFVKKMGGPAATHRLLDEADAKMRAKGLPTIHWNGIQVQPQQVADMKEAGFDSCAVYNVTSSHLPDYSKRYLAGEQIFEYRDVADEHRRRWVKYDATDLPFLPTVTRGWDCSGRCRNEEPMPWKSGAYPYCGIVRNNDVETFRRLLADAKKRVENDPKKPGIILLNAWNEYTEGCWLVPDENIGDASLKAVRSVMYP